jgi:putative membrane-bound dehydrogenase-like protein
VNPSPVPSLQGRGVLVATVLLSAVVLPLDAAEPRVLLDGAKLELIAREPDIATPIGMAFDQKGRLLVVESHTHQRPADYAGPKGDRIRMLSDSDGDGRLDRWSTFAEGYQQAMNLCARPGGGVYLVTRRDVRLIEDTDDDGASDNETIILHLETEGDYPHNGMSGIVYRGDSRRLPSGWLAIGVGENSGVPYTLVGSDGSKFESRDGAGNVYTCGGNGAEVRRLATGFWNPFALCVAGRNLYCVDNDPDASPPCRLINVFAAGDYGFRFQYGRAGVHPLLAWNGELPGTLPAICGVGEAPTGLVFHHDFLWVTSWGDHRIERYSPRYAGTTLNPERGARLHVVVQGDEDFRPTGCAIAPDGSIYFADWVSRSYPVHGSGRIWKLSLPSVENDRPPLEQAQTTNSFQKAWDSSDSTAAERMQFHIAKGGARDAQVVPQWHEMNSAQRIAALQSARWIGDAGAAEALNVALADDDAGVRLFAVRWIADERLKEFREQVAELLEGDMPTERYFLAVIAAIEWLDGDASPRSGGISDGLLRRELANKNRSPALKAIALRLISPNHQWLNLERLREYLASDNEKLRREAVRTLAMQTRPERFALLAEIASDAAGPPGLRADAVMGLAADVPTQETLLTTLAEGDEPTVAREAARVLRLNRKQVEAAEGVPEASDLDAWNALLGEGGDADAGRRLFLMSAGPQCAACHQHSGRGGRVGPDLTQLGAQQNRERIIASILQPSQEIAPHYQAWELRTSDGLTRVGLRLPKGGDDGVEPYADSKGRRFELRSEDIELRSPAEASIMPEGLAASLTVEDLRDLVAFLSAKK